QRHHGARNCPRRGTGCALDTRSGAGIGCRPRLRSLHFLCESAAWGDAGADHRCTRRLRGAGRGEHGMKGNVKVVRHLNAVLTNELTAIDQYFLHAKMFEHWGLTKLGAYERKASIDEMKHAESLMERILFLEGLPNLQNLHKLLVGENVEEALGADLKLELAAHPALKSAIADCEIAGDYVSRDLLRSI